MKYTLVQGTQSNFEVQVTLTEDQMNDLQAKTLKGFQKEVNVPGFRKGHVPLSMVKEQIRPGYLEIGVFEELVHKTLTKVLDENKDTQFIGQPYDFNPQQLKEAKDGKYLVTFKLDVYPEPKQTDKKWEKASMKKIDIKISKEKKDSVLATIKKQYADYKDVDIIAENTVSKIALVYKDKDGNELGKRTTYVGDEEYTKEPQAKKLFVGMKKDENAKKKYSVKTMPSFIQFTGEGTPATVSFDVKDVKEVVLPEFTDKFIAEKFGDTGITNEKELVAQIEKTLTATHSQEELQKTIDDYLEDVAKSFVITVPETFLQEEMKHRMKHMESQLGGEVGFKKFMESMGAEKSKTYIDEMRASAEKSLRKFLLLKKVVDLKKLENVDWNTQLDAEKKLYTVISGDKMFEEDKDDGKKATKKTTKK